MKSDLTSEVLAKCHSILNELEPTRGLTKNQLRQVIMPGEVKALRPSSLLAFELSLRILTSQGGVALEKSRYCLTEKGLGLRSLSAASLDSVFNLTELLG